MEIYGFVFKHSDIQKKLDFVSLDGDNFADLEEKTNFPKFVIYSIDKNWDKLALT